jgi:hypothetical protein
MPPLECCSCHEDLSRPFTRKLRITQIWANGRDEFMCESCWILIFAHAARSLYESLDGQ